PPTCDVRRSPREPHAEPSRARGRVDREAHVRRSRLPHQRQHGRERERPRRSTGARGAPRNGSVGEPGARATFRDARTPHGRVVACRGRRGAHEATARSMGCARRCVRPLATPEAVSAGPGRGGSIGLEWAYTVRFVPLYIDRHDAPGVSPQELADAHMLDVAAQDAHGVRYHTYWFDPDNGSVFCLAEGPSRDAVEAVHQDAHGLLASTVLELDPTAPLNAFFGALPTYPVGTAY